MHKPRRESGRCADRQLELDDIETKIRSGGWRHLTPNMTGRGIRPSQLLVGPHEPLGAARRESRVERVRPKAADNRPNSEAVGLASPRGAGVPGQLSSLCITADTATEPSRLPQSSAEAGANQVGRV